MPEDPQPIRFFIAGIMQGSHADRLHDQAYRNELRDMLSRHFPGADIYDPLANHSDSLAYDEATGRAVFMRHNAMCRDVDVVVAFVPEASMGTAIEMWEAYRHGRMVLSISPLQENWAVKFCSHKVYPDLEAFTKALTNGTLQPLINNWQS